MRRGIFVPLSDEHCELLYDIADRQWRRPVEQACKIMVEGLRRERQHVLAETAAADAQEAEPIPA